MFFPSLNMQIRDVLLVIAKARYGRLNVSKRDKAFPTCFQATVILSYT